LKIHPFVRRRNAGAVLTRRTLNLMDPQAELRIANALAANKLKESAKRDKFNAKQLAVIERKKEKEGDEMAVTLKNIESREASEKELKARLEYAQEIRKERRQKIIDERAHKEQFYGTFGRSRNIFFALKSVRGGTLVSRCSVLQDAHRNRTMVASSFWRPQARSAWNGSRRSRSRSWRAS